MAPISYENQISIDYSVIVWILVVILMICTIISASIVCACCGQKKTRSLQTKMDDQIQAPPQPTDEVEKQVKEMPSDRWHNRKKEVLVKALLEILKTAKASPASAAVKSKVSTKTGPVSNSTVPKLKTVSARKFAVAKTVMAPSQNARSTQKTETSTDTHLTARPEHASPSLVPGNRKTYATLAGVNSKPFVDENAPLDTLALADSTVFGAERKKPAKNTKGYVTVKFTKDATSTESTSEYKMQPSDTMYCAKSLVFDEKKKKAGAKAAKKKGKTGKTTKSDSIEKSTAHKSIMAGAMVKKAIVPKTHDSFMLEK